MSIWIMILRSVLFQVFFYVVTFILAVLGLPTLLFGRVAVLRVAHLWGKITGVLLRHICGLDVEFRGVEKIPQGAFILAAKHQSAWETLALLEFMPDFVFILKRELLWLPLVGWFLIRSEQIPVHRSRGGRALQAALLQAVAMLQRGRQLIVFPEGTRRGPDDPPAYKPGVAYVYEAAGVPCVPVALNAGLFWSRRSLLIRPGKILVSFLDPIQPGLSRHVFLEQLQNVLEPATIALVAESRAKDPSLPSKEMGISHAIAD